MSRLFVFVLLMHNAFCHTSTVWDKVITSGIERLKEMFVDLISVIIVCVEVLIAYVFMTLVMAKMLDIMIDFIGCRLFHGNICLQFKSLF